MTLAWGGIVGPDKRIVDLSSHKTTDNLIKNKVFTVSIADAEYIAECDYVGLVSAKDETDKMEKANFTTIKSDYVNVPIVNELPLTLECVHGVLLRMNRSIEVEGTYGVIKWDREYKRVRRWLKSVIFKFTAICCCCNPHKYHIKKQKSQLAA